MSDIKRVQLTSVQTQDKVKKPKKKVKTFRFVLSLGESNAETCPEYSFSELIKHEKPEPNDDPFFDGVDESEVAAIAQRFEAKYGPKSAYSGKKKRTKEMDDYYDLGDGYDIDDPFIDNTEAYDEVVPSTLTTKHGGFYINQGQLDFRSVSDDSVQDFASPHTKPAGKRKKKKGALDSDSEVETGESLAKKFKAMKRKKLLESKVLEKKKKKFSDGGDGENVIKKKKKKNPQKLLLKKLARQREAAGEQAGPHSPGIVSTPVTTTTAAPSSASAATTSSSSLGSKPSLSAATASLTTGTTTVTTTVTVTSTSSPPSTTELEVNGVGGGKVEGLPNPALNSCDDKLGCVLQEAMRDESSSKSGDEAKGDQQTGEKNPTQLPAQLPAQLLNSIESIKKCAKESTEGKCKFFSPEINKLLLEIELGSHGLAWGSRTAIFGHLGEHLPCGKPALQRRAKKLRESQEEDQLHTPLQELKKAIDAVMPELLEQYRQALLQAKSEAEKSATSDTPKEEASTESEEDESKTDAVAKKPKRPQRKFQWTSDIRQKLEVIVAIKMRTFKTSKARGQTAEEFIKPFLDSVVRPLWPPGWMRTGILLKESRACHEDLAKTPQQYKPVVPPAGKPWPAVNSAEGPASTPLTGNRGQQRVSKTEDVIEISGHASPEFTAAADKDLSSKGATGSGDTVVVHLPGSSSSTPQPGSRAFPSASPPKVSPPPVEVIDITDSPSKPPVSTSVSQSRLVTNKVMKQSHPIQLFKNTAHPQHSQAQIRSQQQQQQPHQRNQQQQISEPRSVTTLELPSQIKPGMAGDTPLSRPLSNLDPVYQAKVVLKPVSVGQAQQQQRAAALAVPPKSSSSNSVASLGYAANSAKPVSYAGAVRQADLTKPSVSLPGQGLSANRQSGPSKPPVSSPGQGLGAVRQAGLTKSLLSSPSQGLGKSVAAPQPRVLAGSKLSLQHTQQRKGQGDSGGGGAGVLPQTGQPSRNGAQQVRSGIVLGTSNSHPSGRFPYAQAPQPTHKTGSTSLRPSAPNPATQGLATSLGSPGSQRATPTQTLTGRPGSFKPPGSDPVAYRTSPSHPGNPSSSRPSPTPGRTLPPAHPSPSSLRGGNSPNSPQKQTSPGEASAKLSLFEKMQSQILSQEAMQDQALKNLALARNLAAFSGSKVSVRDGPVAKPLSSPYTSGAKPANHVTPATPGVPDPAKLQANLLKLRELSGMVPGRSAGLGVGDWTSHQSQVGGRGVPPSAGLGAAGVASGSRQGSGTKEQNSSVLQKPGLPAADRPNASWAGKVLPKSVLATKQAGPAEAAVPVREGSGNQRSQWKSQQ